MNKKLIIIYLIFAGLFCMGFWGNELIALLNEWIFTGIVIIPLSLIGLKVGIIPLHGLSAIRNKKIIKIVNILLLSGGGISLIYGLFLKLNNIV